MKTRFLLAISGSMLLMQASFAQERISPAVATAMKSASADQIKADITYLADDKLLGRKPGTPGYQMAVDYVVQELTKYGVKPAGDKGQWTQAVMMRSGRVATGYTAAFVGASASIELSEAGALTISPNPVQKNTKIAADVIFAGYGITSPENNYDDYKGINAKGKIVVIVRGAPEKFSANDATNSQNLATIQKNAVAHGAIGVIIASATPPRQSAAGPGAGMMGGAARPTNSVMTPKGELVINSGFNSSKLKLAANLSFNMFTALLNTGGKEVAAVIAALKKGEPQSFATGQKLVATYETSHSDFLTYNVAGRIEGTDPVLKKEYVVHSAHLDHMGVGRAIEGDSIYNGAHDNASGVASLLQITKIYQDLPVKPKRSVLILMVTAEEMGLLGSAYFALRPTVNINNVVANVNTDMPAIIAPLLSVTALGAEHSSLVNPVNEAAAYMGLSVEPDPEPKENRFVRSDQYSFIKEGIPALHIKYGNKTADGKNNLAEFVGTWRAKYYHKPQDDINGIFDFDAGKKYAQLNFLIGYLVANDVQRPAWNPGDIFEKKK